MNQSADSPECTDFDKRVCEKIEYELDEACRKAFDSLARYKFQMFGYWAAIWVHLNRIGEFRRPNPFAGLVKAARSANHNH